MSRPRDTHAVVTLPALDVRLAPSHAAELGSQLLMGEVVRRLRDRASSGWVRVENVADGYRGWVREWGLVPATAARARRWLALASARVGIPLAQVSASPRSRVAVSPLFLGNRLIAGRARGGWAPVELPDGRRGQVPARVLTGSRSPALLDRVTSLLGVPYLWGGRTPAGFDCSGFVQQVLAEQGFALPRDARLQCRASSRLPTGRPPRPGDLAFFRGPRQPASHVGICLGGSYFAHCRGRVVVASIDSDNPLCDKDLLPQFMGWYRAAKKR
jgi:cell wall-associated NlpC family hydrolase